MKKIYSIIILMCSFCMAGFAGEAKQTLSGLPSGAGSGASGQLAVVIESANPLVSAREQFSESKIYSGNGVCNGILDVCSIGWVSSNNLNTITENNPGASPDAGFLLHTQYDEHSETTIVKSNFTGKSTCRFFAFIAVSGFCSINITPLSSHISTPLKFKTYA